MAIKTTHTLKASRLTGILARYPQQALARIARAFPAHVFICATGTHSEVASLFVELRHALSRGRTCTPQVYTSVAEGYSMGLFEDGIYYGWSPASASPMLIIAQRKGTYSEDL